MPDIPSLVVYGFLYRATLLLAPRLQTRSAQLSSAHYNSSSISSVFTALSESCIPSWAPNIDDPGALDPNPGLSWATGPTLVAAAELSCSMAPSTSADMPKPNLALRDSSSTPGKLALAFLRGLPTMKSSDAFEAVPSYTVLGSSAGGDSLSPGTYGGVDPAVGVFEGGDFLWPGAGEGDSEGSIECCRLS